MRDRPCHARQSVRCRVGCKTITRDPPPYELEALPGESCFTQSTAARSVLTVGIISDSNTTPRCSRHRQAASGSETGWGQSPVEFHNPGAGVQSARRYRLLSSSPDCGTPGDKIDPDPRVESVAADYTLESSLHCRSLPELCRCILRPRRRDCVAALRNNELWYPISSPRRSAGEKTRRVGVLVVSFFAAHAAEVVSNQRKSPTQLWLGTQRRRRPEQQYRVLSSRARIVPLPRQPHRR